MVFEGGPPIKGGVKFRAKTCKCPPKVEKWGDFGGVKL